MKYSAQTLIAISLLAFSHHGAYAAPDPIAVRLATTSPNDEQLERLVRFNNSCVDRLIAGDNQAAKRLCKAALSRALNINSSAQSYFSVTSPVHEMTLAAVYSNYALTHWKIGDATAATRLLAVAKGAAPSASFVLTNEPLFETK